MHKKLSTKSVIDILKKSIIFRHTVVIYVEMDSGPHKIYDIEPYEYELKDDNELIHGIERESPKDITIPVASIFEISITDKEFTLQRDHSSILDYQNRQEGAD